MARIGDRFKTGQVCEATGTYMFDGYVDSGRHPRPTADENIIPLSRGERFPPVRSTSQACWWKLIATR